MDYLKRHGLEYIKALKESNLDEFSRNYPRYLKLVARYGAIEEEELKEKDTRYNSFQIYYNTVDYICSKIGLVVKVSRQFY